MAENCNPDDYDDTTTTSSGQNAVFVDTNLQTHLALIVSDSDTVSHLKKKIMIEHPLCFPKFGEIKINALKVKRKRCFYHLADSMLVKSAFKGAKKYWFVYVDAFSLKQHDDNQFPIDHAVSNQLAAVFMTTPMGDLHTSSPGIGNPEFASGNTSKEVLNDVEMTSMGVGGKPCNTPMLVEKVKLGLGEIQGTHVEYRNDKSRNMNGNVDLNDPHSKSSPIAKKKRKRESKGDENTLEGNDTLLPNVIEDAPKPKDSLFTECTEDIHLVAGSSSGTKKSKKKKKLPKDEMVNAEPSSVHDAGKEGYKENVGTVSKDSGKTSGSVIVSELNVQHATLSGTVKVSRKQTRTKPVEEVVEGHKLPSSSVGINANRPDAANEKGETDAPDSGARSRSKGRKSSKKHHSTDVEGFPLFSINESDNLKKDVMQSRHANIALHDQNFETIHPQKNEERKELPQNHDPEAMLSGKCKPPIHGEADMHSKESVVSDYLLESAIVMESGKSAGSGRMKMSSKKSVATKKVISSEEHDDNSVSDLFSQVPYFDDHFSGEAKKESFLSPTKKKKTSKRKTMDTSIVGASGQSGDVCGNEAGSLSSTRVDKTQQNAETSDGNLRKKVEKSENSDVKTFADFPIKEQAKDVESLHLNQKVDVTRKGAENMDNTSGKTTKKSEKSAAKSLPEFSTKEQEVGGEVLTPSNDMLRVVDTPSTTKKETKSVKRSSKSQSTGKELALEINPRQTLRTVDSTQVPSLDTLEGNSIGRLLRKDDDGNASKCSKTTDANYQREVSKCDGDSINFKDYFIPGEHNHEVTPVELFVDNMSEAEGSHKETKTKKNAKKVVLPSPAASHDPGNSHVNQESDRRSQGVSKASSKKLGEVVNSSRQEKRLLATPGAIFNGSSESSDDESMTANSDSSTKSPSDYSSSSGFSEGDGKLNLDSSRNGTSGAKDTDGGKSITKFQALGSKNVTLDGILRSSIRFKKAKLTATQSQLEDTESQPVDFVPDSQANL